LGKAQIRLPEICSNVCFGGSKRNRLFMTGSQSLYAVHVETRGAHITKAEQSAKVGTTVTSSFETRPSL
jgi:hypothetical protein